MSLYAYLAMQLTALLLTCLISTLASGQEPVRIRSISTPNRFDFSQIAADTDSGVLLVAGVDFLIRVTPDFNQSTITNVNGLEGTVDYVGYNNNRFVVCFRVFRCEIYSTDDIENSTATIGVPPNQLVAVSPLSVEFGLLDGSEAVYIAASVVTASSSTTRYSLFAYSLTSSPPAVVARLDGQPSTSEVDILQRTLIMSFKHQTRIFFLYRFQKVGDSSPGVRLATLCNNGMSEDDRFASLIEVKVGLCVADYSYLSSARVLTLQDSKVYLVLVYRKLNSGIESRLCALELDALNAFIDDSFRNNSTGLLWANSFSTRSGNLQSNPTLFDDLDSVCRLRIDSISTTFRFALLMPTMLYGTTPVLSSAYSAEPDSYGPVTSLLLTQLDSFSYLYIGTQSGVLIKYLVNSTSPYCTSPLLELEARQLSTTLRDRISELEINGDVLYALTPRELFRVPVEDCGRHATCGECVSDRDPICGWCGVQNACTKMSQCANYNLTNRWIRNETTSCFSISSLAPNTANIDQMSNITISSLNLPQLSANERYECAFQTDTNTNLIPITAVNGNPSLIRGPVTGTAGILCSVPSQTGLFTQTDNLLFNISLRVNTFTNSMDRVLNNNFTLYHCGFNTNCTTCIVSASPCGWCLYNTRCVPQRQQCVMQEWVAPSESDNRCPRIAGNRFELPAGVDRDITLNASNLPQETLVYNYTCIIGGSNIRVAGRLVNASSSLVCPLPGSSLTAGFNGTVRVVWGPGDYEIEQGRIEVEAFQCLAMTNCHTCLQNPECQWCADSMNRTGSCTGLCMVGQNVFTPPGMMCPPPEITSFTPTSTAPGGVIAPLSVFGFNLAVPEQLPLVMLSGLECLIRSGYTATKIECDLTVPSTPGDRSISVTAVRESGVSGQEFSVLDPTITAVFPGYAPEFGGTEVKVNGTNLLVGVTRRLTFGTQTCDITDDTTVGAVDTLTCKTTRASVGEPLMSISIDSGVPRTYTTQTFKVLPNPVVQNLRLAGAARGPELRGTIVSGALDYSLRGDNLGASLVQTLIFTLDGGEISRTVCVPPTDIEAQDLICAGNPFNLTTQLTTGMDIRFELVMDRVPDVTAPYFIPFNFTLYPDPAFQNGARNHSISVLRGSDTISIPVIGLRNLPEEIVSFREARTGQDYFCLNPEITDTEIVCTINGTTPPGGLTVEIKIGENSNAYTLALEVSFTEKNAAAQFLEENMTILIAVGVLVLLACCAIAVLLCLCWVCLARARSGSRKRREEAEHLLSEVEEIENDLADKCRKGFTDLNTQMGLDGGTLQVSTIPMLDFRTFAMRILFPGIQEHPVLHPVEGPRNVDAEVFSAGLHKFDSLLREKEFVRVMVHSMEDNRNFSTRDRCNVASLLTTALHNSMPYLTDLLMDLLEELINKNVTRNTAKLLLRRTESVAEKLLADWLAFNMYAYLQGPVSVSMYKLYLGIKGHLEAGPVDVLSGAAVNSLSEEKLLRTEIEHKKLQVEVDTVEGERVSCCVLDCDTITQTKIKLMDQEYKGMGFSHRPKLEDVEVVLVSAGGGGLQLRDNDMTNEGDEEWRRINTLSHYNLRDGMMLKTVKRTHMPNPGQVWDYPGTAIYDFGHTQSLSRLLSLDEDSLRVFHLQKSEPEAEDYYEQKHTLKRKQYATEIYLPKLVATKRILQSYMDEMMAQIFPELSKDQTDKFAVPRAIKLLYDFLDEQAAKYGIQDAETIHTWKNNSVPLRFWVNLLKNPEFLLDVAKSASLDSALSVISQAFIDSCSIGQAHISRDSPTNKLLYHKEVQQYKSRVTQYYEGVRNAPPVERSSFSFQTMEFLPAGEDVLFHSDSAVYGLFNYAQSYQEEIKNRLSNEGLDSQQRLFEEVCQDIAENLYMV